MTRTATNCQAEFQRRNGSESPAPAQYSAGGRTGQASDDIRSLRAAYCRSVRRSVEDSAGGPAQIV
eukprot:760149-Hanusia_phi.AAC.8